MIDTEKTQLQDLLDRTLALLDSEEKAQLLSELGPLSDSERATLLKARLLDGLTHNVSHSLNHGASESLAPVTGDGSQPENHESLLKIGSLVGPFRLEKKLAEGGMGSVYVATRTDGIHLKVALKTLNIVSPRMRDLFQSECELLSSLKHQHIAHLIDVGVMSDGRPWMAMEYVEGTSLMDYASKHRLNLRQRLELFLQLCDALAHAHRQMIIHRDLKPGNILVTKKGNIKLLDFGIAALIDPSTGEQQALTIQSERLLTPEYASPEQVQGKRLSAASDVYSLGIVLYELLVGKRPYHIPKNPLEMMRVITAAPITRPSMTQLGGIDESISPKLLAGDLDTIILKALERDLGRRYPSVEALASDIEDYLEGRAISARPATWRYRMGKVVRRNPWPTAMIVLSAIFLVCFSIYANHQRIVNGRERDLAQAQRQTAEAVTNFLVDIFERVDPNLAKDGEITAFEVMELGRLQLGQLEHESHVDHQLKMTMAKVYMALGKHDIAIDLLDQLIATQLERGAPTFKAQLLRADCLLQSGDLKSSEQELNELAPDLKRQKHDDQVEFYILRANVLSRRGLYDEAESLYLQAIDEAGSESLRMSIRANLASMYSAKGQHDQALVILLEVLTYKEKQHGAIHSTVAEVLHIIGATYIAAADFDKAEAILKRLKVMYQSLYPKDSPKHFRNKHFEAGLNLSRGQLKEAEALASENLANQRAYYEFDSSQIADSLKLLGVIYSHLGRFEDAERCLREALVIVRAKLGPFNQAASDVLYKLAVLMFRMGRADDMQPMLEQALAINQATVREHHHSTAAIYNAMGTRAYLMDNLAASYEFFTKSLAIYKASLGEDHVTLADLYNNIGSICLERSEFDKAEAHYRQSLAIREGVYGKDSFQSVDLLSNLGSLHLRKGDYPTAKQYLEKAQRLFQKDMGTQHPKNGVFLHELGLVFSETDQQVIALSHFERAYQLRQAAYGDADYRTIASQAELGYTLFIQGKKQQGRVMLNQATRQAEKAFAADHTQVKRCRELLTKIGSGDASL